MDELTFYADLLDLPAVAVTGVQVTKSTIEITCTLTGTTTLCPLCGVVCTRVNDRTTRRLRDLSLSSRAVYLVVSVRQFRCSTCGSCPTERLPFADANNSYPHRQARYVFAWCRKQAYAEVGAVVGMHATTVEPPGAGPVPAGRAAARALRPVAAPGHRRAAPPQGEGVLHLRADRPMTRARWWTCCRTAERKPW